MSTTYTNQFAMLRFRELLQDGIINIPPRTQIAFDRLLESRGIDYTKEAVILSQGSRKRDIDSFIYEIEEG